MQRTMLYDIVQRSTGCSSDLLGRLQGVKGFVFDMDGTLVLGDRRCGGHTPLPGAVDLIGSIVRRGIPFLVFTNGTALTPAQCAHSLKEVGIPVAPEFLLTPATCAADLFVRRGYQRVMALGVEGSHEPLRQAGLEVVPPTGRVKVDAVFCGWHREVTMENLESACHAIWEGASMYSASMTRFFAVAEGRSIAPSRATTAMIRDITGCRVATTGKPSLAALRCAARRLGVRCKDLAVVGDDPELEIAMALRGGCLAVGVRTGVGAGGGLRELQRAPKPHLDLENLEEFLALWGS
jgi:4-nitrophenyl phosphatase